MGELERLRGYLESRIFNLIVFRENDETIGHAIWHETNTKEHRKGDPREKEDIEILHRFMGKKKDFIELHELWVTKEHRGKGYGKQFFDFFEDYIDRKTTTRSSIMHSTLLQSPYVENVDTKKPMA